MTPRLGVNGVESSGVDSVSIRTVISTARSGRDAGRNGGKSEGIDRASTVRPFANDSTKTVMVGSTEVSRGDVDRELKGASVFLGPRCHLRRRLGEDEAVDDCDLAGLLGDL